MPSYTLRKLPDEPIIVFKMATNYDGSEIELVVRDSTALFDAAEEPVILIVDLSNQAMLDMEELMIGANAAARGEASPFHHSKLRQTVFVTRNPIFKATAEELGLDIYGNLFVPVFENYEDALAYTRAQLE